MKYAVEVSEANDDSLNVTFKLTDGGRLSPIYSATVVAFSKPHSDGGRSYLVQEPLELKANQAGEYSAQVRIPKKHAAIAQIRILTLTVNGRRQTAGAAYYDIPLKKHVNQPAASASSNSPPSVAKKPAKAR